MRLQQETGRQFRLAEAPRRLAVAGRREIEQRQPLEQRNVRHAGVQRRDQLLGRVELVDRRLLILMKRRFAIRTRPGVLEDSQQPSDPE